MATKEKATKKATKAEKEAKERKVRDMAHGGDQDKEHPPKVEKGKKAIWHEPYEYEGANGTIKVRGHWEIANEPEPKDKEKKEKKS